MQLTLPLFGHRVMLRALRMMVPPFAIDLYSSGLTLQAIVPAIRRWQCVLLDTTLAAALTTVTVFSASFYSFPRTSSS